MATLLTHAEATGYAETSLHRHVMAYLAALRDRNDPRFHLGSFGTSPQGRELPLVVMSAYGIKTPAEARAKGLPVVLVINGIHAGEVEGKEACQMLMRDLLDGPHAQLIEKLVLVIVPLFNPDGNDALDPENRKLNLPRLEGQIGPKLVGTRVNGINVNLNRDYMRQQASEMRALQQQVVHLWQPELTIDTHSTNGSVHRFSMTYDIPHTGESGRAEPIAFMRTQVMPVVTKALEANHQLLAGWYGNFVEDERALDARRDADPEAPVSEGWMTYPHNPRFGSNYRGLSNRLDLLLECYSYLAYPERVRTTYATILEALIYVATHPDEVVQIVAASTALQARGLRRADRDRDVLATHARGRPDHREREVLLELHRQHGDRAATLVHRAARDGGAPRAPRHREHPSERRARCRGRDGDRVRDRGWPQDPRSVRGG
jgi:hypothetical protein